MIYRFFDCGIYDSHEPLTLVWIRASSQADAQERLLAALSLIWDVEPEQVFIQGGSDELEIGRNAVQDKDAGDRRLVECGSRGELPMYYHGAMLILLPDRDRKRILAAFASAREHAAALVETCRTEAAAARTRGDERNAEHWEYDVEQYERFAASKLD